jgi:hypothetical protein
MLFFEKILGSLFGFNRATADQAGDGTELQRNWI